MKPYKAIETVLAIVLLFILLYLTFGMQWILVTGFVIGVLGALSNRFADILNLGWYYVSSALGFVMSRIILTLVFFLLLTPIALLYRVFSKDAFAKRKGESYFKTREYTLQTKDLKNPW